MLLSCACACQTAGGTSWVQFELLCAQAVQNTGSARVSGLCMAVMCTGTCSSPFPHAYTTNGTRTLKSPLPVRTCPDVMRSSVNRPSAEHQPPGSSCAPPATAATNEQPLVVLVVVAGRIKRSTTSDMHSRPSWTCTGDSRAECLGSTCRHGLDDEALCWPGLNARALCLGLA